MTGTVQSLPTPLPQTGQSPIQVQAWFDQVVAAAFPKHDESLASARGSADAYTLRAKAANTRRA